MTTSNVSARYDSGNSKKIALYTKAQERLIKLYSEFGNWKAVSEHLYQSDTQRGNLAQVSKGHRRPTTDLLRRLKLKSKKRMNRTDIRFNLTLNDAREIEAILTAHGYEPCGYKNRLRALIEKREGKAHG
jgi:hypothetical protein